MIQGVDLGLLLLIQRGGPRATMVDFTQKTVHFSMDGKFCLV